MVSAMTEMTDNINAGRDVIFFDGACVFCRGSATRFNALFRRHGFLLLPLQSEHARKSTGASSETLLQEMHLVTASRQVLRGIDAFLYIAATIPWLWPVRWFATVPGMKRLLDGLSRAIAKRRYSLCGNCRIEPRLHLADALWRWTP